LKLGLVYIYFIVNLVLMYTFMCIYIVDMLLYECVCVCSHVFGCICVYLGMIISLQMYIMSLYVENGAYMYKCISVAVGMYIYVYQCVL
jgi:hypothetical protein